MWGPSAAPPPGLSAQLTHPCSHPGADDSALIPWFFSITFQQLFLPPIFSSQICGPHCSLSQTIYLLRNSTLTWAESAFQHRIKDPKHDMKTVRDLVFLLQPHFPSHEPQPMASATSNRVHFPCIFKYVLCLVLSALSIFLLLSIHPTFLAPFPKTQFKALSLSLP